MRWRGLLLLLTALSGCKDPGPPLELAGSRPPPVIPDAGPAPKRAPAPLFDPALKEGTWASWEVQSPTLAAGSRATFTVLGISDEAVEVLVTLKTKGKVPPALEKGLRFQLQRAALSGQARLHSPGTSLPVHSDGAFHPEPGMHYEKSESRAETITVDAHPVACTHIELKSGSDYARGCVGAKTSPIGFFGGAVELEEPQLHARLVDWGNGLPVKSDAPLAFKPGEQAIYTSDAVGVSPITDSWLSGGNRIRYATSEDDSSWEGTLLEVLFDLAALERMEESAYATSYRVNGDRFAALTFKSNSRAPTGEAITEEWVHAEDPWRLENAPVWVRFWPLQHGIGATEIESTLSLTEWK